MPVSILDEQPLPDLEQAKLLLAAAVEEKGENYVDPNSGPEDKGGCRYVDPSDWTRPGCIVGNVLHRAGWIMPALEMLDRGALNGAPSTGAWDIFQKLDAHSPGAGMFLQAAQSSQDYGQTWGRSQTKALGLFSDASNTTVVPAY